MKIATSAFDAVTEKWGKLPFMDEKRARFMRDLITEGNYENLLEVGFFKGKSSAYFAAILEDLGRGHLLTIDRKDAMKRTPNIETVLSELKLSHRVTPVLADRSHTWVMAEFLSQNPRPQFDFCYFDGGHTWDVTALGVLQVDMLLKPGGLLVLDDLNWTIEGSLARNPTHERLYKGYSQKEKKCKAVQLVWETVVVHLGYVDLRVEPRFGWGIARKPVR